MGRLHASGQLVCDALVAEGAAPEVAESVSWSVPSHLSDEWRGLIIELSDARQRAERLAEDARHAGKSVTWRCETPLCRHCRE